MAEPQVSPGALEEVKKACRLYERLIRGQGYGYEAKNMYLNGALEFVQWLSGSFVPGNPNRFCRNCGKLIIVSEQFARDPHSESAICNHCQIPVMHMP